MPCQCAFCLNHLCIYIYTVYMYIYYIMYVCIYIVIYIYIQYNSSIFILSPWSKSVEFNKSSWPPPEPDQMYALSDTSCRTTAVVELLQFFLQHWLWWCMMIYDDLWWFMDQCLWILRIWDLTCLCSPSTWTCLVAWRCGQVWTNFRHAQKFEAISNQTQIQRPISDMFSMK